MIFWHIIAYLLILIAKFAQNFTEVNVESESYQASNFGVLVISFLCSEILALIVNEIVSKHLETVLRSNSMISELE